MTIKDSVAIRQTEPPRPFMSEVVKMLFWPIGLLTMLVAACLRLGGLASKPGWEWDEGVYANVSKALAETGLIQVKTEYLSEPEPYLYHPPFHFWLESAWFSVVGSGITQARLLAVVSSLLALLLLLVLLRNIIGTWALAAVALIATDVWLIFSQRVSWIENTLILVGVVGLCVYQQALLRRSLWLFAVAGVAIGMAVLYKHVGVIFLGAVVINAVVTRRHKRGHAVMAAVVATLAVLYVGVMIALYGATFIAESTVQLMRSTGEQTSSGALNGLGDIVTPLLAQYKIFVATLALAGLSAVLVVVRTVQMIKARSIDAVRQHVLLYAWALAAMLFFVALQLRFPHYFMLMLIPLYCYLIAEIRQYVTERKKSERSDVLRRIIVIVAVIIVALQSIAFYTRFIAPTDDAALRDVGNYAQAYIPADAKVIADESVGVIIPQPYCKTWRGDTCKGATYVISYTSQTQKQSTENGLPALIATGSKVYEITGFKETITVYKLPQPVHD